MVTLNDILCHRLMYFLTSLPLTYSLALMCGGSGIWLCQQIHNGPLLGCHNSNRNEEGVSKEHVEYYLFVLRLKAVI